MSQTEETRELKTERGEEERDGERGAGCRASLSEGERIVGLLSRVSCQARKCRATERGGRGRGCRERERERQTERTRKRERGGGVMQVYIVWMRVKQHVGEKKERVESQSETWGSSEVKTNVNDRTEERRDGGGWISHVRVSFYVLLCILQLAHEHDIHVIQQTGRLKRRMIYSVFASLSIKSLKPRLRSLV